MNPLSSLTNRIFLAGALLVVVSIGVAIYRVNVSVSAQAERDLQSGLDEAASLVDEFNRTQFADFVVKSELIADLPTLKGAAATDDPPTVQPIAEEYQLKSGADLFVVVGRHDRVLARAGRIVLDEAAIASLLAAGRGDRGAPFFWSFAGGLLHVAAVRMDAGLSTLVVGVSLDHGVAARVKTATNSEIVVMNGSRVVASSLDPARTAELAGKAPRTNAFAVTLGGEGYVGRAQPLGAADTPDGPVVLVLRSRTAHTRFLASLRWHIALTGMAAVLVATVVGYLVARTVTRPLRALTGAMRDMAATGDLTRRLPELGRWDDEDVRLVATTFHQLTGALGRFQREAALKERLSSLGRLSTVVAHEIRNPLMIIKAAARGLRKHASTDVAAAAESIDEEVVRLNQVVTGVLDFTQPIQFAVAPTDLADLCRGAVQAAQVSAEDVPIVVEVPAAPAPVATDGERVRSVLVNVLNNAQHAVRARADGGPGGAPITLRLVRTVSGRWRIDTTDRGVGIAPADLPRIFDPYFTTRRGGSGLGLAIARNIIEGLGGTMTVRSELGEGTLVRIELGT